MSTPVSTARIAECSFEADEAFLGVDFDDPLQYAAVGHFNVKRVWPREKRDVGKRRLAEIDSVNTDPSPRSGIHLDRERPEERSLDGCGRLIRLGTGRDHRCFDHRNVAGTGRRDNCRGFRGDG